MTAYRWVGVHAYNDHANGRVIEPGEELPDDIAERVAESHPYDVEAIDEDETDAEADTADESEGSVSWDESDAPFDPGEYSVADLEDRLAEENFSTAELSALAGVEQAGGKRKTALEAIDAELDD